MEKVKSVWKKFKAFIIAFILIVVSIIGYSVVFPPTPSVGQVTLTLRPNAAGTYQEWILFDTTHWGATSDQTDATVVYIEETTSRETENLADTSHTEAIVSVTAYIRAEATGSGAIEQAKIRWRTHTTDYESAAKTISRVAYTDYSEVRTVNPNTGIAWTWTEVNALETGARASTLAAEEMIAVAEFWIVVSYTSPPPTYSDVGANTTAAGMPCLFHTKWTDDAGLSNWRFGCNNTGSWVNDTWQSFSGNPAWSNVTKTLNSNWGSFINWRIWANDTNNNWNNTGIQTVTIQSIFGYNTLGTGELAELDNVISGSVFTITKNGIAESIHVGLKCTTTWTGKIKCAIYTHTLSSALVGSTEERTITLTTTATWYIFLFITKPNLAISAQYILVAWAQNVVGNALIVYDSGATDQEHHQSLTYDGFPNSLTPNHYYLKNSIYCAYTKTDSPPSVTLNIAGNPNEDSFGYRNGTFQRDNWMYINASISDDFGVSGSVYFEWKNSTAWKNYTMTHQTGTDFYYINKTSQPQYQFYTFNIYADDTLNQRTKYVWKYADYLSSWGTEEQWRKYVGLNYQNSTNLNYTLAQFFQFNYTESQINKRCLPHEQPTDETTHDTGIMKNAFQTSNYTNWCNAFVGYLYDENTVVNETFTLTNVYLHIWWSNTAPQNNTRFYVSKQDSGLLLAGIGQYMSVNSSTAVATYNFTFGYHDIYYLTVIRWDITDMTFIDNDVNLFALVYCMYDSGTGFPSINSAATPYLLSFMIFNLPTDNVLLYMDSDKDGISDYMELFYYYTCPFAGVTPTDLSVGWNNFAPFGVDVGHTLGEVNESLNIDGISWTVCILEYTNGTRYVFVYGYSYNVNVQVTSTDDRFYIYCTIADTWYHQYP